MYECGRILACRLGKTNIGLVAGLLVERAELALGRKLLLRGVVLRDLLVNAQRRFHKLFVFFLTKIKIKRENIT